jgi:hypothetical protein
MKGSSKHKQSNSGALNRLERPIVVTFQGFTLHPLPHDLWPSTPLSRDNTGMEAT